MGFMPAKLFHPCSPPRMCVCCPALSPSSRRPVKRYKKLLAEIFPKTPNLLFQGDTPNERKIMKLCEYATKNPLRIPKVELCVVDGLVKESSTVLSVDTKNPFMFRVKEPRDGHGSLKL